MRLVGSFYLCELARRLPNSTDYEDGITPFKAKIVDQREQRMSKIVKGLITEQTRLVIKTNDIKEIKQQDKVNVLGQEYLVESVASDTNNATYGLGAFNKLDHFPIFIALC